MATIMSLIAASAILATMYYFWSQTMSAIENLRREVEESRTVSESAVALINGLAQQIRDNIGNEQELQRLADSLDQGEQSLAAAVAANTPAQGSDGNPSTAPAEPV